MDEDKNFHAWAIVEQNGHRTFAGLVQEEVIAGTPMLRIDLPEGETGFSHVKYLGTSTIFSLTPCSEARAREYARRASPLPLDRFLFPPALPAPSPQCEFAGHVPENDRDLDDWDDDDRDDDEDDWDDDDRDDDDWE